MQENKNKSYKQNFILEYEVWFLLRVYPVLTEYYKKLCNKWYFLQPWYVVLMSQCLNFLFYSTVMAFSLAVSLWMVR